ncbi:AI-2E family transporter [Pacificoceanicola onchidii]|uniref:AI-2E family transporter n=1 Tax=Pacificoceanicola onchidii TaxID=2562685 RepID=UPI0010A5C2F2|nr:AI-2E family transporter [Pacificoceanicola onchidii]
MALPVRDQFKYWGIATAVFAVVLWFLGDVLLPFVLGSAIAYFLDPVADRLENMGFTRGAATGIITVIALVLFVILALAVIPTLIQQAIALFEFAPALFRDLQTFLTENFPSLIVEDSPIRQALSTIGETIQSKGVELLNTALSSAASLLNLVVLFIIAPVVAVYMLLDWDNMIARIDELVPLDHRETVRSLASEVDRVLAGFVRGMGSVCMILGIFYAAALWLIGLQFGLVVGVFAGLLTFIPYVGAILGGILAIGLAMFQFWGDWWMIVAVWAIFQSGQFIEGNILTPRMVGNSVGLHPVWLLLALSVFGSLFGFVGMLVAVPMAAAIGVLIRFAAGQYRTSRLYLGLLGKNDT